MKTGLLLLVCWSGSIGCGKASADSEKKSDSSSEPSSAQNHIFCGLGHKGDWPESHAWAVSADGKVVVGTCDTNGHMEAFRWDQRDGMQLLGGLVDKKQKPIVEKLGMKMRAQSRAHAVSDDGTVVVGNSQAGSDKAFRWTKADGMQDLGALPNTFLQFPASSAAGISADGLTIVGESTVDGGDEAIRWTKAAGMRGIGKLPGGARNAGGPRSMALAISGDGNTIVGFSGSKNGEEAFRWTEKDGMQALGDIYSKDGYFKSTAWGVSGDGSVIVGDSFHSSFRAFKWTAKEGMTPLDNLKHDGLFCRATAVSRDGSTIVGSGNSDSGAEALRWTEKNGVESIQKLLVDRGVDMTGWQLWEATGVSADGAVIVGFGQHPDKSWEAWRADFSDQQATK